MWNRDGDRKSNLETVCGVSHSAWGGGEPKHGRWFLSVHHVTDSVKLEGRFSGSISTFGMYLNSHGSRRHEHGSGPCTCC